MLLLLQSIQLFLQWRLILQHLLCKLLQLCYLFFVVIIDVILVFIDGYVVWGLLRLDSWWEFFIRLALIWYLLLHLQITDYWLYVDFALLSTAFGHESILFDNFFNAFKLTSNCSYFERTQFVVDKLFLDSIPI
jgi:hypothetical protein